MLIFLRLLLLVLLAVSELAAVSWAHPPEPSAPQGTPRAEAAGDCRDLPIQTVKIVGNHPHDPEGFTQGLVYHGGFLYESTGLYGRSSLRKVDIETGRVVQSVRLPATVFGEGLTRWKDRLIQLTWRSRTGFVYELDSFRLLREFHYPTEGWGLTEDGKSLIMTDGTESLIFLDPVTFQETGRVAVHCGGVPVRQLNELEWAHGEVLANVLGSDWVARISPMTGAVLGWIDLTGLRRELGPVRSPEVLNGIAYDPEKDRLFVTGKNWPRLFEIRVKTR